MDSARCRDRSIVGLSALSSPDLFFPDPGSSKADPHKQVESAAPAKRVCALCPVRTECLNYALRYEEGHWSMNEGTKRWHRRLPWGIWGGHTDTERHRASIEHLETCETKKCRPPCRPIEDRVRLLEELFQFKIGTLVTKREREEMAS
jgi:WhiB family transcriptional regulator, redox-sensing transcriptional regulator